jgi:autotransporter adhesin
METNSTASGKLAAATGQGGSAYGRASVAGATAGSAFGWNARANATNSTALGFNTNVSATAISSVAIGEGAQATASKAVALGAQSVADVANTISVGSVGKERRIVNVAAGTLSSTSTDVVNGGQLYTANQRVAAAFGSTLDASGQMVAPSYVIQGVSYSNVGSAFSAVNTALSSTATSISNLQTQINNGSIGLVQQNSSTKVIGIGSSTDGTVVDVSGTSGNRTVTGVAAGAVNATSTDAVNGSQLYATNQTVASLSATVAGISGTTQYTKINSTGAAANASGTDAIAIGANSQATQSGSLAIGLNSSSTGVNAIAIGAGAPLPPARSPSANNRVERRRRVGDGAVATGTNAAASAPTFGWRPRIQSRLARVDQQHRQLAVSFGSAGNERRLTNVAAGINPNDAVNVGQLRSRRRLRIANSAACKTQIWTTSARPAAASRRRGCGRVRC